MSRSLASDATAAGGPRLWWITDDGGVASHGGPLDCQRVAAARAWLGIAARGDRLLLWTDTELYLVDADGEAGQLVVRVDRGGFERAGWAVDAESTIEAYSHQTTGHPTDRLGFRYRVDLETMRSRTLAHRQGTAPPWGSRGFVRRHGDLCSGPAGVAYEEWQGGRRRYWWKRAGRGGRRRLPDELVNYSRFRVLEVGQTTFVCAFRGRLLALFEVRGERDARRLEAPDDINDAVFHEGALFLAVRGRDPEAATSLHPYAS